MKLSSALAQLGGPAQGSTKTASAAPVATPAASSSDAAAANLQQALKEATAPEPTSKTASQASPIDDLAKLAADVAGTEHDAMTKEAQLYGAAVADGFVARLAQYQDGAAKLAGQGVVPAAPMAKTAGDNSVGDFQKFAAENPDVVKEAHDLGYIQTRDAVNKLAQAAYEKSHNATIEQIYKVACDSFVNGFSDTIKALETAR